MEARGDAKLQQDARMMREVAAGSAIAKQQLVSLLWRRVNNMARYFSRDATEAEDLTQEALLQILRAAPYYQASGCVEAWADVIAVRTMKKKLRRLWRGRQIFESAEDEGIDQSADGEDSLLQKARNERLAQVMGRIDPARRMALLLKLSYGYTLDEVAATMELPATEVKNLLRKGRADLRRLATKDRKLMDLLAGGAA